MRQDPLFSSATEVQTVRLDIVVKCAGGGDAKVGPLGEVRGIVAGMKLPSATDHGGRGSLLTVAVQASTFTWLNLRMSSSWKGRVTDMVGQG